MSDAATAERAIAGFGAWYHRIELAPGVTTPGCDDSPGKCAILDRLGFPADCTGLRVLDVGTADGFFAFEAERRGADVTALDIRPPDQNGFAIAARALGSRVVYQQRCVYDVRPERDGRFDVVLFLGVLYHLRHPLLALDRMRQVVTDGGRMLIDTHSIERGLCDNRLRVDPATTGVTARPLALWQTWVDHRTAYTGFSPNVAGLREALYKTQWTMAEDVAFVGSRLYAAATPAYDAGIEAQIVAEGLR